MGRVGCLVGVGIICECGKAKLLENYPIKKGGNLSVYFGDPVFTGDCAWGALIRL
jgi:hypothetical protein